ncbi:2-succinylbenzoate--CoA ligase [Haloarcula sp. CBA1130]|uniref:AMP-binding protein n=1 Tax=unclassified Haloarcula TaxID=2624677 RepID=UPI001246843F|nr:MULTISPECIES: AMP-binding protein [unclassified Haloarcula]KAA9397358.1 2-succinylbenzoate--CoA ligase [Haloarcula sp. CBA1129]KAA9402608.1 2-succinylbenzoate--CoA ligase [Haloarcula sp. CBA1130]
MRDPVDWPTTDLVTHRAATTPDRTAMVAADSGTEVTYRELDTAVDAVAAELDRRTDAPDATIATLLPTRPAVGTLLFAAMRQGATLAPLNVELDAETIQTQLSSLDADLLVCGDGTASLAADLDGCPVVSVDGDLPGTGVADEAAANVTADEAATDVPADETATDVTPATLSRTDTQLVIFTSGTTSEPKGVQLTVGNLVASAIASSYRLGVLPTDRWLVCLPTYHMGGLAPFVRSALYGTAVVVQRSFDAETTQQVIADRSVTGVSLVPTMLSRLLDAGWEPPASLRFVLLGGGPASESLVERCQEHGVPVCPTYGMTETASQIATARPETAFERSGTVGQPLVFTDVTVVADGEPCDPGEHGEIVVDGPTVTPGYLTGDGDAFGDHGFRTGDVGYRDADGHLWVEGRVDDQIVTGGENVDASTVTAAIRDHPDVADAAVVGVQDPEWGQRVAALVVGEVLPGTVRDHCAERLAAYEVPKTVQVADALPRTASGTVDRTAVRSLLAADTGTGDGRSSEATR